MRIDHVAIWTKNLELFKEFYVTFTGANVGPKYVNKKKGFESYFLSFESGVRLELMSSSSLRGQAENIKDMSLIGYAHLAIGVGSKEKVDDLTLRLQSYGCILVDGPRYTGDGYYESVILDPDGNRIEITI